jgi:hypothetical protein
MRNWYRFLQSYQVLHTADEEENTSLLIQYLKKKKYIYFYIYKTKQHYKAVKLKWAFCFGIPT